MLLPFATGTYIPQHGVWFKLAFLLGFHFCGSFLKMTTEASEIVCRIITPLDITPGEIHCISRLYSSKRAL